MIGEPEEPSVKLKDEERYPDLERFLM